jgi:hypothetical protein
LGNEKKREKKYKMEGPKSWQMKDPPKRAGPLRGGEQINRRFGYGGNGDI